MSEYLHEKQATEFDAIRLAIASPERVLEWSHGKVTKPETINYRTQKPEKDGLFCERIFGPTKDWECYCGKYKGAHYRGVVCDRCGVLVARSIVRRERMGHIELAVPVTHVWFLRGTPSTVGLLLNMTSKSLEKVVYFAAYLVTEVNQDKKKTTLKKLADEFKANKTAVEKKFDKTAKAKDPDKLKAQAEQRSQEVGQLEDEYTAAKAMIEELNPKVLLSESDFRALKEQYGELFQAKIGAAAIQELLAKMDLDKTVKELTKASDQAQGQRRRKLLKRLKMMEGMKKAKIHPDWMVVKYLPVIPPDLRPMVQLTGGRFATSDLNDLYRRVINRNNRLQKLIDMHAPEVICRNEMRMLQEAVDALIDNSHARGGRAVSSTGGRRKLKSLSDMLRGKQGRFRQNLLGKRVDYSGRSVIVAGPNLKLDECGIPKMMALELFKPFVIGSLIERELAHNVKIAGRMIEAGEAEVWDALDEVIKEKFVLLNRAPTLHRLGVQAFKPVLIEGKAIQLHPLVCKGFNADFDGDQMAVHLPLSDAAQAEARVHMAANRNLLKPSDGSSIIYIAQDMVLGIYYMTYERYPEAEPMGRYSSVEEALFSYESGKLRLQSPIELLVNGQVLKTTIGRALFNEVLPPAVGYLNETVDDKRVQQLLTELFEEFGEEVTAETADRLKAIGFEYATVSGLSTGVNDYITPSEKTELLAKGEQRATEISDQYEQGLITEDERHRLTVEAWRMINDEIQEILKKRFQEQDNSTTITVVSGARAKLSAVSQIAGMLGLRQDVYGNTIELPVKSNYKEGLTSVEYFIDARGSRKGLVDTALKTADAGYLTRRLVDVSQDVFTLEDDCGDKEGLVISRRESEKIGEDYKERLVGRIAADEIKSGNSIIAKRGELISKAMANRIADGGIDTVNIRSVLKCLSVRGICRTCYGVDLGRGDMVNLRVPVGVIAAQAVGEPGTQLTLRTFHYGGVAEEDITHGFPRIEELFEARSPKGQALLADIGGVVSVREEQNQYVITVTAPTAQASDYDLAGHSPTVKKGQKVTAGETLALNAAGQEAIMARTGGEVTVLNKSRLTVTSKEATAVDYTVPGYRTLLVKEGDMVKMGQRLTTGSINLQDYLRLTDEATVQRYIMTEIQSIFNLQGQTIADKHLEVIVRQMFSRVQIEDPGDSLFITGDIVSKALVIEENNRLREEKKRPLTFKLLLLGIIKVSTWSDSFLSAASFQDTTRVLISSATAGRIDRLYGLKENVIIGRQIPVGTGYHGIDPKSQ